MINLKTVLCSIISGVVGFFISQIIMEKWIKPKTKFRKIIGKIYSLITMVETLYKYRNETNIPENLKEKDFIEVSMEIRKVAYELSGLLDSHPKVCRKKKNYNYIFELISYSIYLPYYFFVNNYNIKPDPAKTLRDIQKNLSYKIINTDKLMDLKKTK